MSLSEHEGREMFDLHVVPDREEARVRVFDGSNHCVHDGRGMVTLALPRNLYTVRSDLAGVFRERVVRLTEPTSVELDFPLRSAALPLVQSQGHSQVQAMAAEFSRKVTHASLGGDAAGLFIFVHGPASEGGKDLMRDLVLLDGERRFWADLGSAAVGDSRGGWAAFNASAREGAYVLQLKGSRGREVPLFLSPGWDTQVFVPCDIRPDLSAMRICMARREKGFQQDERILSIIEIGMVGLQNGEGLVPAWAMDALLHGKFENPILGLIGAYALLFQKKPNRDQTLTVLRNLRELLGNSPDIRALEFLAAEMHIGHEYPHPVKSLPMFRLGYEAVVRGAVEREGLVDDGGLIEKVARRSFRDSPWSSWRTFRARGAPVGRPPRRMRPPPRAFELKEVTARPLRAALGWVEMSLLEQVRQASSPELKPEEIRAFARRNLLPMSSVLKAYDRIRGEMGGQEESGRPRRPLDLW